MAAAKAADKSSKPAAKLTSADYVHLHNHTQYSLLDGLTKIPELVTFAKESGMQSVAMTDHGTLSGTIEFYKECNARGVKPLIGIETYVAARKHTDKDPQKDKNRYHLVLLAMNNNGYQNLMQLSTKANLDGFYYFPRVDHELLEEHNEGLIAMSACMGGEIGDALKNDDYAKAKEVASWYKGIFGDRYYLEVQDHGHPDAPSHSSLQKQVNDGVFKLGKELDIPVVLTCDAHYLKHEDQYAHEILLCVGTGAFLADEKRMSLKEFELHVIPPDELIARWGESHPEVITNTRLVADRCQVNIELGKILIPKFPVPKGEDEKSYLHKLVWQGLAWRYGGVSLEERDVISEKDARKSLSAEIIKRAEYELSVMNEMGYNGYFLIVQDFINWGKDQGVIFGPGRGSAAGSIVSFAIRITEIDPMKYGLMFERFLNPHRISMPDIDIDIQDTRRDEVIQYCVNKYGKNRVANIVTFGRMFARNAVRDVSRVLQVPYAEADRLAKMIPQPIQGRHIPLKQSLKEDPDLKREYATNETSKMVLDQALILEGTVRSHGVHAAGVVIAPDDIVKFVPLEMAQKGVVATQYAMGPVEDLGLLKMDFLGLSNLTIIKNALRIIKKVYNDDIELATIPIDDDKTLELFRHNDTTGIFQFESAGMKRYLKELQPTEFADLVAMNALYRPGPMAEIPRFIQGKNNPKSVKYLHQSLEPILQETYGVMVYQEQIIQLLQLVAGYSAGEADLVRKAIGKKKRDIMQAEEPKFVAGCEKQGLTAAQARQLWAQIQPFADYSFNKAHATCYAQIAYWTAYLKAHYPAAFMAAVMTSDYDDTDRLAIEIAECKHMGMQVLPPDVNESFGEFAVVPPEDGKLTGKETIRFGMNAVKNVGSGAVDEIVRARETGRFNTLEDFISAVNTRVVNRKTIESLVRAGAFDALGDRSTLLHNMDVIIAYGQRLSKERASGQVDLFGGLIDDVVSAKPTLKLLAPEVKHLPRELLGWERELLGLYLSQQPLEAFEVILAEQTVPLNTITAGHDGKSVVVGGAVVDFREITTKNGQKMGFVRIEDAHGDMEVILFPSTFQQTLGLWERDRIVVIRGKVNAKDRDGNPTDETKIMADEAREITHEQAAAYQSTGKKPRTPKEGKVPKGSALKSAVAEAKAARVEEDRPKRLYIRISNTSDQQLLQLLKGTIDDFFGITDVVLVLGPDTAKQPVKLPGGINPTEEVLTKIADIVGQENVKLH